MLLVRGLPCFRLSLILHALKSVQNRMFYELQDFMLSFALAGCFI